MKIFKYARYATVRYAFIFPKQLLCIVLILVKTRKENDDYGLYNFEILTILICASLFMKTPIKAKNKHA